MYGIFVLKMYGRYCTVFLVGVYGKMYGVCVKPPWPPCLYLIILILIIIR